MRKFMWKQAFTNLVYPHERICLLCGQKAEENSAYGLCGLCIEDMVTIKGKTCLHCGAPQMQETYGDICYNCSKSSTVLEKVVSFSLYEKTAKKMILDLKYQRKTFLAEPLACMLAERIKATLYTETIDGVVPVPLNVKRKKQRGFNQMNLIGQSLSQILNLPFLSQVIMRREDTAPMKDLDRKHRILEMEKAFCIDRGDVKGKRILLIDDVYTTGSTLEACAVKLLEAGALSVLGAVICVVFKE